MNTQGKSILAISVAAAVGGVPGAADATTYDATLSQILVYSNNGTAGTASNISSSNATFTYDDVTSLLTQTGGTVNQRVTTSPTTTLYRTFITGLVMGGNPPGAASAASYSCLEGNFGSNVGSSICGNYNLGANFANDSTTTWGPGTAVSRTMGGDDIVIGPQQSIAGLNNMAQVSLVGTSLVLRNATCNSTICNGSTSFNSGQQWTLNAVAQVPALTGPDPFTFTDQTGVALSTLTTSDAVSVTGISAPGSAPISVAGGEYSVGCTDTYTAAAGSVSNGQTVCVRHTSAATPATNTDTVLTINNFPDTFTSTTVPPDTDPDAFIFAEQTGVALGAVIESAPATITGINTAAPISVTGGQYSINGGAYSSAAGTINNNQTVRVRQTSSASPTTATTATLTIGTIEADFTVTTAAVQPDTTPDQFTFVDQENVAKDTLIVSEPVEITGINSPAPISVTGGEYSIGGAPFTNVAGTVTEGQTVAVRHTSASTSGTAVTTVLSVGPAGTGTRVSDAFSSATPRSGGSSSADGLVLSVLGLLGLARRRKNRR